MRGWKVFIAFLFFLLKPIFEIGYFYSGCVNEIPLWLRQSWIRGEMMDAAIFAIGPIPPRAQASHSAKTACPSQLRP